MTTIKRPFAAITHPEQPHKSKHVAPRMQPEEWKRIKRLPANSARWFHRGKTLDYKNPPNFRRTNKPNSEG